MNLSVLLFASYAEAFGSDRLEVDVPDGALVSDLVRRLRESPSGASLPARPVIAVNRRHALYSDRLAASDEIAVIPPVAGG